MQKFSPPLLVLNMKYLITLLRTPDGNSPNFGKIIIYSWLQTGQATLALLFPFCFSSIQRCRQFWCTHFVVPQQRHGRTHFASLSSSSVAKHTQHERLKNKTHPNLEYGHFLRKIPKMQTLEKKLYVS